MQRSGSGTTRRSHWAAIGAACAVALGSGSLMTASATVDSGERPVLITITPCRLIDTRGPGTRTTPLGPGETFTVSGRGTCGIPGDAVALSMNVAIVDPSANSFLTVFPADVTRPPTANLNWSGGDAPRSNAVTSRLAADGRLSFFNLAGTVHVVADVLGYYVHHTHDDRNYTKSQVDVLLASKANNPVTGAQVVDGSLTNEDIGVYWTNFSGLGHVFTSSGGVTSVRRPGAPVGKFDVDFGRDVRFCTYVATQGNTAPGAFYTDPPGGPAVFSYIEVSPAAGNPNAVGVNTYNQSEQPADYAFHLVVICT